MERPSVTQGGKKHLIDMKEISVILTSLTIAALPSMAASVSIGLNGDGSTSLPSSVNSYSYSVNEGTVAGNTTEVGAETPALNPGNFDNGVHTWDFSSGGRTSDISTPADLSTAITYGNYIDITVEFDASVSSVEGISIDGIRSVRRSVGALGFFAQAGSEFTGTPSVGDSLGSVTGYNANSAEPVADAAIVLDLGTSFDSIDIDTGTPSTYTFRIYGWRADGANIDDDTNSENSAGGSMQFKFYANALSFNVTTIPEPSSVSLLGLAGFAFIMRRRK
ncbi:PEP-CTERM sorting domain-containing protein [Persicirhabdus sediminis]|nr:PEP-CTERM sorting domain-containing protein [Persicirhabdus sediminis]